jgi:3-isopropylmalate dehydrogenase
MRILTVAGDGIGPELMHYAKKAIQILKKKHDLDLEIDDANWGAERWLKEGVGIPDDEFALLKSHYKAILFAALGDKRIPDMAHGRAILLRLRRELDLFINLRPIKLYHEKLCPLKGKTERDINIIIFRENTQDIYLGAGGSLAQGTKNEFAVDESLHSYYGVYRIINAAFSYAKKNQRSSVCLVDKANAIKFGGALWQRVFYEVAQDYPDIKPKHLYVDVAAMRMVEAPESFDIIVTSNLFGDILSDLGAGITGGIGLLASANIHADDSIALFEPVHGSAPDIVGKGIANPSAMLFSVALMFEHLKLPELAKKLESAVHDSIRMGQSTPDLGGTLTTESMAEAIFSRL